MFKRSSKVLNINTGQSATTEVILLYSKNFANHRENSSHFQEYFSRELNSLKSCTVALLPSEESKSGLNFQDKVT